MGNPSKSKIINKIPTNNIPPAIPKENELTKSKIETSLKKTKSTLITPTRANKFKAEKEPEIKNVEKDVEKIRSRVLSIPRKGSEPSLPPNKSQSVMKKMSSSVVLKTSRSVNESTKQQIGLIPRHKLYFNGEGIKEENRSFSPSYKHRLFNSTVVFTGVSRILRRKIKDKNPTFVKYLIYSFPVLHNQEGK